MEYVLKTNNLVKIYKKQRALNGVTMNIEKGDIYGFVGENGSGKTTVIRVITGLIFPKSGDYELFGVNGKSSEILNARKKLGAIVESPSIYKNFTARDNILMQASILGIDYKDRVDELLNIVGLNDDSINNKKVGNFSLGMRQRLGIAMSLVGDPEFLILDEPMNGLDPAGIVELRELIIKLNKEKNITFLISSHILTELSLVATKYGIISKGKMLKEITKEELNLEIQKTIQIELENKETAFEILKQNLNPEDVVLTTSGITIYKDYDINTVMKILVDNNISITSINCNQTSIEEYYMNILGGRKNV